MRIADLVYKLAFVGMAAVVLTSCKKENGIDNNTVIKKPYSLYVGDSEGALHNTNDGNLYKLIFPKDGYADRAILASGKNIMFIKGNLHLSEDNGLNFNPKYRDSVNPIAQWQSMILDVPDHQRVYLASTGFATWGVAYSENNGLTWVLDGAWDPGITATPVTSFTQLKNGTLFSRTKDSLYKRDNKTDPWTHIIPTTQPAGDGYLSHYNNTLLFTDFSGANGVQASNDNGVTWSQYPGLPVTILRATYAPFDQVLLVGTDSMGVYRLQGGTNFVPSNNGLETNTTVYAITAKDDIYKNQATKRYVYIATNKGLYRSEDLGQNWALVKEGNYRAIY